MTSRPLARLGRACTEDAGFLLVEVMVSAVVLLVLSVATLQLIDRSGKQAGSDRSRGVATAIAQSDQDRLRALKPSSLYSYGRTVSTKIVDGVTYNITSDVALTRDTSATGGATVCDSGGTARADYFRMISTVDWPNTGSVQPVSMATILSPGVADPTKGSVTVKLLSEAGNGVSNATVSTGSLSATTDDSGCASFSNLTPATYNFAWSKSGYVDRDGDAIGGKPATVTANQNSSITDNYDIAATIPVTVATTGGAAGSWPSFTITSLANNVVKRVPRNSAPQPVTGLYPFSAGYAVYAGSCPGNQPDQASAGYLPSYYSLISDGNVVPAPGATTSTLSAYVRHVIFPVTVGSTSTAASFAYKIAPDGSSAAMTAGPACTEGIRPQPTDAPITVAGSRSGTIDVPLPWGSYDVCAQATFPTGTRHITMPADNLPQSPWTDDTSPLTGTTIDLANSSSGTGGAC